MLRTRTTARWIQRSYASTYAAEGSSSTPRTPTKSRVPQNSPRGAASPKWAPKSWGTWAAGGGELKKLLTPYDLAQRVKTKCREGPIEAAVELVENMPLDAQNAIVWNVIISTALAQERYRLAHETYLGMKKRGIVPTIGTYVTMFSGLQKIEDWSHRTQLLPRVHAMFEKYMEYVRDLKEKDPKNPEVTLDPAVLYIRILARAQLHTKIFDLYYSMDEVGPLAPNQFVYSAIFASYTSRKAEGEGSDRYSMASRNASEAKLLWKRLVKDAERNRFEIDGHVVTAAVQVLLRGRTTDHAFAFDIIREYLGLGRPGESSSTPTKVLPLNPKMFYTVLQLCNASQKYRLTVQYVEGVMERPLTTDRRSILSLQSMSQYFLALTALASVGSFDESAKAVRAIRWILDNQRDLDRGDVIDVKSFNAALLTCWKGKDWDNVTLLLEMMVGRRLRSESAKEPESERDIPRPLRDHRLGSLRIVPDEQSFLYLMRTAYESGEGHIERECIQILKNAGLHNLLTDSTRNIDKFSSNSPKDFTHSMFYLSQLSMGLTILTASLLANRKFIAEGPVQYCKQLQERATEIREKLQPHEAKFNRLQEREYSYMGSGAGFYMMQRAINFYSAKG